MIPQREEPIRNSVWQRKNSQRRIWLCGVFPACCFQFLLSLLFLKGNKLIVFCHWYLSNGLKPDLKKRYNFCVCAYHKCICVCKCVCSVSVASYWMWLNTERGYVCVCLQVCVKMSDPEIPNQPLLGAPRQYAAINVPAQG